MALHLRQQMPLRRSHFLVGLGRQIRVVDLLDHLDGIDLFVAKNGRDILERETCIHNDQYRRRSAPQTLMTDL